MKNIKKIKVKLAAPLKLEESAGEVNAEINE